MSEYKVFDSSHEVIGQVMLAFLASINKDEILPYLQAHGLEHIDPNRWYPTQDFLDVLNDVNKNQNAMFDFVSIGMKIFEVIKLPPEVAALPYEKVVMLHDKSYHDSNRGTNIGEYIVEQVGERHFKITAKTPYPDDFVYGSLYGEARRFLPHATRFTLRYDDSQPRREKGGDATVFDIDW